MTQMDIAANLWGLVHNDSGHGGYFNDLDSTTVMLCRCVALCVSLTWEVSRLQCFRSGRGIWTRRRTAPMRCPARALTTRPPTALPLLSLVLLPAARASRACP